MNKRTMNQLMKMILTLGMCLFCSCGLMEHRSFHDMMVEEDPFFVANRDFNVVSGDEGRYYRSSREIYSRTPSSIKSSGNYKHLYSLEEELLQLENAQSDYQYKHYQKYQNKFASISEKIYFLKLDRIKDRNDYLLNKGLISKDYLDFEKKRAGSRRYQESMNQEEAEYLYQKEISGFKNKFDNEITLGLGQDEVISRWGYPTKREKDGADLFNQEIWSYRLPNGNYKYLYLDNGSVQGWSDTRP